MTCKKKQSRDNRRGSFFEKGGAETGEVYTKNGVLQGVMSMLKREWRLDPAEPCAYRLSME